MKKLLKYLPLLLLCGCAGFQRNCASGIAGAVGADWVVVQYKADGNPINCWKLEGTSIDNEQGSDGIYLLEPSGHLVHISGWYSRVQVAHNAFKEAANVIGVDIDKCKNGRYE